MQVLLGAKSWSRWPGQLIGSAVGFCGENFSGGCMLSQYQAAAWLSANQCNRPLMILLLWFVRLPKVAQKARIKNWKTCTWSEPLLVSIYYSSYCFKFQASFFPVAERVCRPINLWINPCQVHHGLLRGSLRGGPNSTSGRVLAILAYGRPTTWDSSHWEFWELAERYCGIWGYKPH